MKQLIHKIFALLLLSSVASCQEIRDVKVTVTEENGDPIKNANVSIHFIAYNSGKSSRFKGITDVEGNFQASDKAILRMYVRVSKEGYYETDMGKLSRSKDHNLTCILREKINPTGLYAVKSKAKMPLLNETLGFDFEQNDWVAPHGKGVKVMCMFSMDTNVISDDEHMQKLTITFPNKGDGIIKISADQQHFNSDFTWLYNAPEDKYNDSMTFIRERSLAKKGMVFDAANYSYALRLNTELDELGNIITANYLRVSKGLGLYGVLSDRPGFGFTYYYNPTPNDRNLEFDPTKNLFQNLSSSEQVREP